LLQTLPESDEHARQELTIQIAKGDLLVRTTGFATEETGRAFGRARELCEHFGNNSQWFSVLDGLRMFHRFRLELRTSSQLEERRVSIAERLNDPARLAVAHGALGSSLLWMGELAPAREHLEHVRSVTGLAQGALPLEPTDYYFLSAGFSFLAWNLAILGFLDQAVKLSLEAVAWAQALSRLPYALTVALLYVSELDQFRRDVPKALEHSAGALGISAEYEFPAMASMASVIHGWARSCRGEVESGIAEIRQGIAGTEATGIRAPTFLLLPLIEAYMNIGRTDEASRLLAETLETVDQTGHRLQEAELYRLKGELLLNKCNEAEAETCFRRAIEVARSQSAKWWELRATMSLARLLAKQGRRHEARSMLAEIYNWFTEGFDTADLKEAKALLDELSA
jgi:tetratricopeptide (TPR) repeat protein